MERETGAGGATGPELGTGGTAGAVESDSGRTGCELSQDLPAIWSAGTTTNQERKQLLRMTIESVQLDGVSTPGRIEIQIRWRSGTITVASVKRAAPGEALLKTPEQAVSQIHEMAGRRKYTEIAEGLNSAGLRTAFGRRFTSQHVAYICRRDGLSRYRKRARRGSQERPKQTDTEKS